MGQFGFCNSGGEGGPPLNRNFGSKSTTDLILMSNPRFFGMANYLGPFSGASDRPEGQELGGGAVGGL